MKKQFEILRLVRTGFQSMMAGMTLEQINKIPEGFNNNLAWHYGHLIAAQQGIMYLRSGKASSVPMRIINIYKHGTKPERDIDQAELDELRVISDQSMAQLETDIADGMFNKFDNFVLGNTVDIVTIAEALDMLLFHEATHFGNAQMLKRAIKT